VIGWIQAKVRRVAIRLYDTRTREVRPFEPRDADQVGIYACGPTVYSRVHVGNARPFVVFSQLKRFLEHEGHDVTLVANITDINDKIYDAARAAGRASAELAREMTEHYVEDTERLGLGRPDHEPLASEYIDPILDLIDALVERDHAYAVDGDVYFRVRTLPEYGELSHRDVDQMDQGEGVEGADRKEDPLDFALWKATKDGEDTWWDSPWGRGRPGWHIECSAMAETLLGVEFDIHGGGIDLVFPHHENEQAQTKAGRGRDLARTWMHNGMLEAAEGEKMAKSVGNIRGLAEVLDDVGPEPLLLHFATGHYRQPLAFSPERLEAAGNAVRRIREAGRRLVPAPSPDELRAHRDAFFDALRDDFNTARALAALYEWVGEANKLPEGAGDADLREMLGILGLERLLEVEEGAPQEAQAIADRRAEARAAKDWAEADRLRDELRELGWEVRDGPQGPELVPAA
jgi:cysteinyl-tRNA synthetase